MPVKWTAERDQLLLLKILETHDLKLDPKKVVAAWPGEAKDKPTPRAITERLVRIRQNIKDASGKSNEGTKLTIASGTNSAESTPSKPKKSFAISTPGSGKRKRGENQKDALELGSPLKREMDVDGQDEDEDNEPSTPSPSKKGKSKNLYDIPAFSAAPSPSSASIVQSSPNVVAESSLGLNLGSTLDNDGSVFGGDIPVKRSISRARRAPSQYGMVQYGEHFGKEDSDAASTDDIDSSVSEFIDCHEDDEDYA
ncbi:uncharacterized protein BDV17DRAFT_77814 [Aspergillus undulatus]|uniref:uncharacterized protein n=1 Tax=Aspergillus undulatus TaxID=1810928 RepID=UPI003CCCCDA1